jgi:hypothetical protein
MHGMAVLALSLDEAIDSVGPAVDSVSPEDGMVTRTWRTPLDKAVTDFQDVIDTENFFVGGTATAVNQAAPGKLARTVPAADPAHTTWFCRKVNSVRGFVSQKLVTGGFTIGQARVPRGGLEQFGPLQTPNYALYPLWEFNVSYGPRVYPVALDSQINVYSEDPLTGRANTFYWPDRSTDSPYLYADEWKRFMAGPHFTAQNDFLTAQQGSLVFRCDGGVSPNGFAFTGMPRVHLRTSIVTFDWFGVPYRYVSSPNSYLDRFRGLVNQYPWFESPTDPAKKMFGPGSLLYLNYEPTEFSPPLASLDVIFAGNQQGGPVPAQILGSPRLCNIRLIFLHTRRKAKNPPTGLPWKGDVVDGHNAQPWLRDPGSFYYTTTPDLDKNNINPLLWKPPFPSFPVEILFTDPDAPQPAGFPPPGQGGI